MTDRTTSCDIERLRLLLASDLPPDVEEEMTAHVTVCSSCRETLESLAGGRDWWSDVKTCLAEHSGSIDQAPSSDLSPGSHATSPPGDDRFFPADFAVDFLDPCDQPGTIGRIDDIEILEVIGQGGMGIVLKGYQRELGRYVAVKVMAPHLATSGSARQRFAREARAAAAIVHPHVMAIHSVNSSSRLPYLVMPFVACESLQERLDREGPLELKQILRIGRQVAAGLAAAHAQGLVHRDVKPANILLEKGVDRVMLTDFGLARAADDASLTRTGVIAGTPQYMSPEQARGESVDARSDLFSLGSVIYAMCTGHPPFRAETSYGVLRRITDAEPRPIREVNPDLPVWLASIVVRLHEKESVDRFESATDVAELLEACLSHVQQPTTVPLPESLEEQAARSAAAGQGRIGRAASWIRCRPRTAASVGLVAAGLIIAAAVFYWNGDRRSEPAGEQTSVPSTTQRPAPQAAPIAVWDDGADRLLLELDHDSAQLERRAQQFWNDSTSKEIQE